MIRAWWSSRSSKSSPRHLCRGVGSIPTLSAIVLHMKRSRLPSARSGPFRHSLAWSMSDAQHFIVATAGHVDHGKSALIKALTGTDPGSPAGRKARGITIDLGFAHLDLPSPGAPPSSFRLGIVDVPGHEDFVKNMVAGVGSIDLALLVVAADDGWMPQTEEHLQILTYFGVRRAVVTLTKADLTTDEAGAIAAIRERLAGQPICRRSHRSHFGGHRARARRPEGDARACAVRHAAAPRHRQAEAAGRSCLHAAGRRHRGDRDAVWRRPAARPVGGHSAVGQIGAHSPDPVARPRRRGERARHSNGAESGGCRCGRRGASWRRRDARRARRARARPSTCCWKFRRGRPDRSRTASGFTSITAAATSPLVSRSDPARNWRPGTRAVAQLRLEAPAFVFAGDHFTVRDWSEQHTLAGALVLDPDATRKAFRSKARQSWLEQAGGGD